MVGRIIIPIMFSDSPSLIHTILSSVTIVTPDDQLRLETISRSSRVGDALSLEFVCHYPKDQVDVHCPDAYRVWLVGPSIHSVDYASSSEKVGTDGRRIRVTFDQGVLLDPGDYELFAWPEHYHCDLVRAY